MYNARVKKKQRFLFLLLLAVFLLPLANAVTITDTTFFSTGTNFTIFVDSITLQNVTVTATTIQFNNLTSVGSNFTNSNATFDARADFFGLDVGLVIRNVNTSTNLFTSTLGDQDFNATFTSGQRITILPVAIPTEASNACSSMLVAFGAFPVLIGLVGTIILLGGVILLLRTGFISGSFNGKPLFAGILVVVSIAVLIIISLVLFGVICLTL